MAIEIVNVMTSGEPHGERFFDGYFHVGSLPIWVKHRTAYAPNWSATVLVQDVRFGGLDDAPPECCEEAYMRGTCGDEQDYDFGDMPRVDFANEPELLEFIGDMVAWHLGDKSGGWAGGPPSWGAFMRHKKWLAEVMEMAKEAGFIVEAKP